MTKESQYTHCNNHLDYLMNKLKNTQMEREEYAYIASFLKDSNFLVFGTGYDSDYWRCVNINGHTVFLEDDEQWIDDSKKDILKIEYTTKRNEYEKLLDNYKKGDDSGLTINLPDTVKNVDWDVIYVDAPVGNSDKKPGRMQSIYAAYKLSSPHTQVFVHDCDRDVENIYTSTFFSINKELTKLRHLRKNNDG
jgi:uncharacterized protein (TIGR01627 family)